VLAVGALVNVSSSLVVVMIVLIFETFSNFKRLNDQLNVCTCNCYLTDYFYGGPEVPWRKKY